ncbi:MAG: hypothetical protein RQ757_11185 [Pseudomonadales bacterium]|nr:hypothetical protein [Pseudomonadales bacterium]
MSELGKNRVPLQTRQVLLLLGSLLLAACGVNNISVVGSYPQPNVNKLPLSIGVFYDDELRNHTYVEYTDMGQEEYRISSGETHIELFNSILPSMFERVVLLESPEAATSAGIDAVFSPSIEEFQLALPQKTQLDVFEVWLKYNMRLVTPDGGYIADWVLTAYGKTTKETLRSTEAGINGATVAALRDLASNFTLGFTSIPDVRDWLVSR